MGCRDSDSPSGPSVSMAIRVRMLRTGTTETGLAKELGVTTRTVQWWLATGKWGLATLDRVARCLGWRNALDIANAASKEKSPQVVAAGEKTQRKE